VKETIHACCVAIAGRGVLISGPSGSGKSDLALRLIDRGAALVSDDYTVLQAVEDRLLACPPATIAGKIEVRAVGIVERPFATDVRVALMIDLGRTAERMPIPGSVTLAGVAIPSIALAALEHSAPIKVEAALHLYGLTFH
jgi:serine kinase of HPr protein (carbohydrate metabolism regulator)